MGAEARQLRERIVAQMQKAHPPPEFRPDDWVPVSVPGRLAKKSFQDLPYLDPSG